MLPAFQLQHLSSKNLKVLFQMLINFLSAVQGDIYYYQHLHFPKESVWVHFTPWFWAKPADMAGVFLGLIQKFLPPIFPALLPDNIPFLGVGCDTQVFQVLLLVALKRKRQRSQAPPRAGEEMKLFQITTTVRNPQIFRIFGVQEEILTGCWFRVPV